jgi:uncharacterized protein YukE
VSFLVPDPGALRALAARIDAAAEAARTRGSRLGAAVAATGWRGTAAAAFDAQAAVALGALHTAAGRLADAADDLRRHADAVESVLDVLTGIVRAGLATLPELLELPGEVLRGLGGPADALVSGVVSGVVSTAGGVASAAGDLAGGVGEVGGAVHGALGVVEL